MTTLRFRSAEPVLSATLVMRLRRMTRLSIAEIRDRAASGTPLLEVTAFDRDWQDARVLLVRIAREIAAG